MLSLRRAVEEKRWKTMEEAMEKRADSGGSRSSSNKKAD